ncbi:LAMI_0H15566g1_1 [Lachancea mirantina]|uniref:LAMI_0H15566g1_1 n=1 Tax=Lachancea mirantina TaxID=1230905 RepID=A0A1G4KIQ9_9SACH|nr:LAMI_0H15566g1_1 [Lachancea mirantina]
MIGKLPASGRENSNIGNDEFKRVKIGEPFTRYASGLNQELLERGRLDFFKYRDSVKGQLSQIQFELIQSNALTIDTLMSTTDTLHPKNAETKYLLLKRRFYVDSEGNVRDHKRRDSLLCDPDLIYDLIICSHLKNDHLSWRKLHHYMRHDFANITRAFVQMCTRYCSGCNPQEFVKPFTKFRHNNIYKGLMPLERVQVEILTPFERPIQNKFPQLLFCRDYYSRFIWLLPLKDQSKLTSVLATYLLSLPRMPMFLETVTIDRLVLFETCQEIARLYELFIGLGSCKFSTFQRNGINRLTVLLQNNQDACIKDWNMCLKKAASDNTAYNPRILGIPSDVFHEAIPDYGKEFEYKRETVIDELFAKNVAVFERDRRRCGMLYLESDNFASSMEDEELISTEQHLNDLLGNGKDGISNKSKMNDSYNLALHESKKNSRLREPHQNFQKGVRISKEGEGDREDNLYPSCEISMPSTSYLKDLGNNQKEPPGISDGSQEL